MGNYEPRIGLSLKVAQKQILTPGLVQMVRLLQLNNLELTEAINEELMANPVLEVVSDAAPSADETQKDPLEVLPSGNGNAQADGDEKRDSFEETDFGNFFSEYLDPGHKSPTAEIPDGLLEGGGFHTEGGSDFLEAEVAEPVTYENFLSQPASLHDHLEWQLSLSDCTEAVRRAAYSVIGNLNEDGYLAATLEEVVRSGGHLTEDVEKALVLVQTFDPPGVAARDLQECLLIQLRSYPAESKLAQQIVQDHMKQLENRQYREIARALDRPPHLIERAVELIRNLDPRPGLRYNKADPKTVRPDVYILKQGDEYLVRFDQQGSPHLRISPRYRRMLRENAGDRELRNYIKERCNSALQLMKNIEQRKHTIVRVCELIIRRQREFLDKGIAYLRPMMIKEIAEELGVHPSTVSRAVASKYAHTPQGVFELRYFFSESVQGPAGGATSLINLKRLVKEIIEREDSVHPLTDEQITALLHQQGFSVTRRTVAKYREDMRIPSTHHRRVRP